MESSQLLSQIESLSAVSKTLVEDYVTFLYQNQNEDPIDVGQSSVNWQTWYKGKMSKQSKEDIDDQLKELRNG